MKRLGDNTVSIGIPAYDRVSYLVEAVDSALNQTVPPAEVIVSQNANPDPETDARVLGAIRSIQDRSDLVRANRNDSNCNLSANINSIADLATSEYLAIIGDDDRLKPDFIETVEPHFSDQPDVVFGDHDIIDSRGELQPHQAERNRIKFYRDQLPEGLLDRSVRRTAAWKCAVPIFSCAIKTSTLRTTRLVDDLFGADTEFFARLAEQDGSFAFVDAKLTEIRYHPDNIKKTGAQYAKLVDCLSRIRVADDRSQLKKSLISNYTAKTVKKLILEGNTMQARGFLLEHGTNVASEEKIRIWFQRFCLGLPDALGLLIFKTFADLGKHLPTGK